jgi:hypothetical protein
MSALAKLLQGQVNSDHIEHGLNEAAREAFEQGWTYMDASFQLGDKAIELGMASERAEEILRSAFEIGRRKEVRDDIHSDELNQLSQKAQQVRNFEAPIFGTHYKPRQEPNRFLNLEPVSIPWPSENWRLDLQRLIEAAFQSHESWAFSIDMEERSQVEKVTDFLEMGDAVIKKMRSLDSEKGSFVRINPTEGDRETDITDFRYVLIENRTLPIGEQLAYYKALNLPCAALVNCAGKTIQAWVKIEASDFSEYQKRLIHLLRTLNDNGFFVFSFENDPLTYAAMPGVLVDGKQQYLIGTHVGADSWEEWAKWSETYLDGLPLLEYAQKYTETPVRSGEVIDTLLREQQKASLISKGGRGKSLASIQMALALAHGEHWLDFATEECQVLYVNMEQDPNAFVCRVFEMAQKMGVSANSENLDFLHLMGLEMNAATVSDLIIKRAKAEIEWNEKEYSVIIIDGIGKFPGVKGEKMTSQGESISLSISIDRIAAQVGAAVVVVLRHEELKEAHLNLDCEMTLDHRGDIIQFEAEGRYLAQKLSFALELKYPIFIRRDS